MIFLHLINNITLLLSLSILYSLISRRWDYTSLWHRVMAGILFGLVAIVGMMNPLNLQPGVIFDGRSIILSIGGLFGGPITAIISALISSAYRIYLGGAGTIMGVSVILSSSILGIIYYYTRRRYPKSTRIGYLLLFGITVHLCMLFLTSTLPAGMSFSVLKIIALPVLLIYPAGSLLMCLLFLQQQSRLKVIKALKKSEENYRLLVERASSSIIKLDRFGRILFVNTFAQNSFGYKQEELIGKFAIGSLVDKNKNTLRVFAGIVDDLFQNPDKHATLETEVLCKSGEIKWVSWTYKAIQEDNANLLELLCIGIDITDKKKVELALIDSEKKFRLLHESIMDGYALVDMGGRIIDCNTAFQEMTGYAKEELQKLTYKDLTPARWHEFENSLINENFFQTGYTQLYEKEYIKKNGEIVSIELRTYLSTDDDSRPVGMWAIIRDISYRKKVEKDLQKSEEKYRTIIELAADTILLGDCNGTIIGANLKATELTGFSNEELIGKNISTLFSNTVLENKPLRYDLLLEGKVLMNERTLLRKDGRTVDVEMNSKKMPLNTYIAIIRDITERKLANEAIKQSEERFRTVVTSAPVVMFALDLMGIFTLSEGIGLSKIGLKPGQVVGQSVFEVYKDYPELARIIKRVIINGESIREDITINDVTFDTLFSPINGQNNEIKGVIGVATEITDRILAQQKILESKQLLRKQNAEYQALNEELKEGNIRIREINEKLIKATEKAQESDKLKTSFLANMSHEIRTPMNGIIGFSQLLQRSSITKDEQKRYVDIIVKSSNQLLLIINDIIDISNIEAGHVTINKTNILIDQLVNDISDLYSAMANNKNINLVTSIPKYSKPITIHTDDTKTRQILGNLVNNAIKFTEKGNIEIGYSMKDGFLELFVKDDGIGIDEENQSLIFERFRQVEGATRTALTGTGLGLAISKSLVELLGGKIWVESIKGEGSKFIFTLPLS